MINSVDARCYRVMSIGYFDKAGDVFEIHIQTYVVISHWDRQVLYEAIVLILVFLLCSASITGLVGLMILRCLFGHSCHRWCRFLHFAVPYLVRYCHRSFRFQNGFLGYHLVVSVLVVFVVLILDG